MESVQLHFLIDNLYGRIFYRIILTTFVNSNNLAFVCKYFVSLVHLSTSLFKMAPRKGGQTQPITEHIDELKRKIQLLGTTMF